MKTAKEILLANLEKAYSISKKELIIAADYDKSILKAMEEYAKQQSTSFIMATTDDYEHCGHGEFMKDEEQVDENGMVAVWTVDELYDFIMTSKKSNEREQL